MNLFSFTLKGIKHLFDWSDQSFSDQRGGGSSYDDGYDSRGYGDSSYSGGQGWVAEWKACTKQSVIYYPFLLLIHIWAHIVWDKYLEVWREYFIVC